MMYSSFYLMNSCTPTADIAGRQHLWSASQRKLIVPRYRLNSFGRRCFAVAGPSTWNSLPDSLRDPALSLNIFRRQPKTHFFCEILTRCTERNRDILRMRSIYKSSDHLLVPAVRLSFYCWTSRLLLVLAYGTIYFLTVALYI